MRDGFYIGIRRLLYRQRRKSWRLSGGSGSVPWGAKQAAAATLGLGLFLGVLFIGALELRLRPVVEQLSASQVNNRVTKEINDALLQHLSQVDITHSQLAVVERDAGGTITAVTSDMARVNRLRGALVDTVLQTIASVDVHTLGVPLGNLFDMDLLWAKGPLIQVRSLVSGTVSAEVNSQFEAAGINQTLHRIILDIRVPLTIMLPGCHAVTQVETSVCLAETVIVGAVPGTYLQIDAAGGG